MLYDQLSSRGFYQVWPKGFFPPFVPFILLFSLICTEREGEVFVHSPSLINEYFWSKKGKKRKRKGGRLHPWARVVAMVQSLLCASQQRSIREQGREGGSWSRRKTGKRMVVHRQEINPGKLIPKHPSIGFLRFCLPGAG